MPRLVLCLRSSCRSARSLAEDCRLAQHAHAASQSAWGAAGLLCATETAGLGWVRCAADTQLLLGGLRPAAGVLHVHRALIPQIK